LDPTTRAHWSTEEEMTSKERIAFFVINVLRGTELSIITIYRSLYPQENILAREKFELQLKLKLLAACKNDIVLVDFNKKNLCHLLKQTGFC
jgi:hypothetical protein